MVTEAIPPPNGRMGWRLPYAAVALVVACTVLVAGWFWDIHFFDPADVAIIGLEPSEIGEVLVAFLLVIPALVVDLLVGRQRVSEAERMRFAMTAARIRVWEWNLSSDGVTWTNTTGFGLTREEVPQTGRAFFALVHPDDRQALRDATDRAKRDHADLLVEYRLLAADGGFRWVQAHGRVAYDLDGKPSRFLGVNIDVSERKLLEGQLLDAHRQADRLMRVLQARR